MDLIPVVDLKAGRVVHAVGGRRADYRPVVSRLTTSTNAADIARALVACCGASAVYVADLDAITGTAGSPGVTVLGGPGADVLWDGGVRTESDFASVPGGVVPVLATETLQEMSAPAASHFARRVFSVDLNAGRVLGGWPGPVVAVAARGAVATAAEMVILLDLSSVGGGRGPGALPYCDAVRAALPGHVKLAVGGGVRDRADLRRLADAGVDAALVATALHAGTLP